ncbi:MAG TPA: hypothetical protein VEJ18_07015 [Planctomycetota bacterium]|nr:hypothetical protein [Planctomycetota bacterium]
MNARAILLALLCLPGCESDNGHASSTGPGLSLPLPAGWSASDVGTPELPGRALYEDGIYTLSGAGADIWNTSDAFHFAYVTLAGDGGVTARVLNVDQTDAWAKAGVMIRESLAAGSPFAMAIVTPVQGAHLQFRESAGGPAGMLMGEARAAPVWLRLARSGQVFSAAVSADGQSWSSIGSRTIPMGAQVLAGLCVTSHNPTALTSARFQNVSVAGTSAPPPPPSGLPAPWLSQDVGSVGSPGGASASGGSFTLCGSGADIWGDSDAFRFLYQPLDGDVQLSARVESLTNTDPWAKAGVMIRESLAPDAKFAMAVTTPSNGATFQYRTSTAGAAGLQPGRPAGPPAWVRVSRSGSSFSGAVSTDGTNWTSLGSVDIPMAARVYVGLCVTAHNNAATACAGMDDVRLGATAPPPPPPPGTGTLTPSSPISRVVYQRNNANEALVRISGACAGVASVDARLLARQGGTSTPWVTIDADTPGSFEGTLTGTGGWYDLELRGWSGGAVVATSVVERVGIGEVFVVVGHSVAHGDPQSIPGASDDRVSTVHFSDGTPEHEAYLDTADPRHLPTPGFTHYGTGARPAPFGYNAYIWSRFGEIVAGRRNVPVLIYNAAFGGTSLEHWAKSARGELFEHGFVKASIRMPYINLYNALNTYIRRTGIRAVLSDHGQNDWPSTDEDAVVNDYLFFIQQSRADLGHGALAYVVNRQTPLGRDLIKRAQNRVASAPFNVPGPDYDALAPEDRYDGIHLSLSGQSKAAQMWADALTDGFFASSQPWLP